MASPRTSAQAALRLDDLSYQSGKLEYHSARLSEPLSVLASYLDEARALSSRSNGASRLDEDRRSEGGTRVTAVVSPVVKLPHRRYNDRVPSGDTSSNREPRGICFGARSSGRS